MNHTADCQTVMPGFALPQATWGQRPHPFTELASRGLAVLAAWHRRSHSRRELAMLDEHQLQDAGITRADVEVETAKFFWQD